MQFQGEEQGDRHSKEVARLREEAMGLRIEMDKTRSEIKAAREEHYQRRIETRVLPPMAQMTRIQKRYFLEPWMTALAIFFGALAGGGYVLAMFTWMHVQFAMLGLLFTVICIVCVVTKLSFMDWNSRTEGEIRSRQNSGY